MKLSFKTGYILYDLLLLMPFVDMITGYAFNLNMNGIITYIGQGYRIFIFLYMVCTLYCHKFSKKQLWLIIFTIFLFLLNLIQYIRFNGSVIENFSYTLKLLLPVYIIETYWSINGFQMLVNTGFIKRIGVDKSRKM